MKTCKTCTHWQTWPASNGAAGECTKHATAIMDEIPCMPESDMLMARAAEDDVLILTGPNFGCIHHLESQ